MSNPPQRCGPCWISWTARVRPGCAGRHQELHGRPPENLPTSIASSTFASLISSMRLKALVPQEANPGKPRVHHQLQPATCAAAGARISNRGSTPPRSARRARPRIAGTRQLLHRLRKAVDIYAAALPSGSGATPAHFTARSRGRPRRRAQARGSTRTRAGARRAGQRDWADSDLAFLTVLRPNCHSKYAAPVRLYDVRAPCGGRQEGRRTPTPHRHRTQTRRHQPASASSDRASSSSDVRELVSPPKAVEADLRKSTKAGWVDRRTFCRPLQKS